MYIVVSSWEIHSGKLAEAVAEGNKLGKMLLAHPGVESIHHFASSDSELIVIVNYSDESAYNDAINDPNGPFERGMKEVNLDGLMSWKQSWRGAELPT